VDIELRHLKLITTVAQEGTLTQASRKLFLTQSALSHQLKGIEEELGVPLFHRVSKRMVLTPAGERLLKSASVVSNELRQVQSEIKQIAKGEGGILRISTECYTTYHWLPRMISYLQDRFPAVEVQIVLEATRCPLTALGEGRIDLAIFSDKYSLTPQMKYTPLFRDELVAVMAPTHPLATKPFVQPKDFADYNFLMYDIKDEESTILQQFFKPAGVVPKKISKVQLTEAKIELAKSGWGLAVMARWAVSPHLKNGSLIARPLGRKGFIRQWYAGIIAHEHTPKYVQEFIDLLAERGMLFVENLKRLERKSA
jgi:LysR family transcriptional regulator for metE and metH